MTTHGGYTALLGNNNDFYDQVTAMSWSTLWEGAGQQQWANRVNRELDEQGIFNEVDRDNWLNVRARETMKHRPDMFVKATVSRVIQFWHVLPGGDSSRELPDVVLYGVALFYSAYWCLSLRGLWRVLSARLWNLLPVLLLPIGFMCVHAVYWSNMRMRAPVLPVVALLAALGTDKCREKSTP